MFPPPPPPVLVPRLLQLAANERVDKEGKVRSPLDEAKVLPAAERFRDAGVGRSRLVSRVVPIAGRERRGTRVLREALPGVYVSASFEVLHRIREYNRVVRIRKSCG